MDRLLSSKAWLGCFCAPLTLCLLLTATHSYAQRAIQPASLVQSEPAALAFLDLAPKESTGKSASATPASATDRPELPDEPRNLSVAPAYDLLRLTTSSSRDEAIGPDPGPISPRVNLDANTMIALQNAVRRLPSHNKQQSNDPDELVRELEEPWRYEPYHWRGLIAQSLFFNVVESTVRMASDDQIRYLVARKPFWHDYIASIKQFNMGRWNDGDNFLVNYVGHPMQGAVAAFIEVQNDPTGRQQEISATHDYWMSRFKGFLWATAFSAHSEISPLGEAGIGNEGGWTYPIGPCHRPCKQFNIKTWHYTNNTGWVDFIITPTVGMLWVLAEDTLDRYVSDFVQGDKRSAAFPLILRGALNPSRTMANAMRLKAPWYRDFQHALPESYDLAPQRRPSFGVHMLPSDDEVASRKSMKRFSFAAHYRSMPLGSINNSCAICIASQGAGLEADYAITRWISASFSVDKQQGLMTPKNLATSESSASAEATGSTVITGFGVRLVHDRPHNTFSLAIRPGIATDQVHLPAHVDPIRGTYVEPNKFTINHTAASLLLSNDYKINRTLAVRSSFGATIIRYRTAQRDPDGIGKPPYITFLSHEIFTNHTTWVWQGGPVIHF